jgi:2-oxoglutarate ferredoxin oxidoreductase subunit alpha
MPVNELTRKSGADAKLRPYVANMVFVGILSCLLDIEMSEIEAALNFHFGGKRKAVDLNLNVCQRRANGRRPTWSKTDPFRVERMTRTEGSS